MCLKEFGVLRVGCGGPFLFFHGGLAGGFSAYLVKYRATCRAPVRYPLHNPPSVFISVVAFFVRRVFVVRVTIPFVFSVPFRTFGLSPFRGVRSRSAGRHRDSSTPYLLQVP